MSMFNFREKRFKEFIERLNLNGDEFILDVGGLPWDWINIGYEGKVLCLSLSNLEEGKYGKNDNIEYKKHDVTKLPYDDKSIDIVYCNSLLEHVGKENQQVVADEIKRVAKKYWVQVPYKYFLIEPHYKFPLFHIFPFPIKRFIANYWTGKILKHPYYLNELETISLPTKNEFNRLFPESLIYKERFLGFLKSLIAYRN